MVDQSLSEHPRGARNWIGFLALCVGMFMAILDIQVVVTSLSVIDEKLDIGADRMSWIQTGYIITEVIAIAVTGLMIRVLSLRWLFVSALAAFTLASIGCAMSGSFSSLLFMRLLQGLAGGALIPIAFSAIFLLFPAGFQQSLASTVGGVLAVLAPALGPLVGGWITETYSWQWLFLINVAPGILAGLAGLVFLPRDKPMPGELRRLDWLSLVAFGLALALLVLGLKEAPSRGWFSGYVLSALAGMIALAAFSIFRPAPALQFGLLRDRGLAFGCAFSLLLGFVLYGTVYVMPVFLSLVRLHGPYTIGVITLVMGLAQLASAPFVVQIDRYFDARWLTALGFAAFGASALMNSGLTVTSDYDQLYWPQIVRGLAVALCILPPIRLAMAHMPQHAVGEASSMFNLSRNIGGIIGIAASDTILFGRTAQHAEDIQDQLKADPSLAPGLIDMQPEDLPDADDAMGLLGIADQLQAAGLTMSVNECWFMFAVVCGLALALIPFVGRLASALPKKQVKRG
jgi:MFS transporter, DHA2 family, multidrug resistance protein